MCFWVSLSMTAGTTLANANAKPHLSLTRVDVLHSACLPPSVAFLHLLLATSCGRGWRVEGTSLAPIQQHRFFALLRILF